MTAITSRWGISGGSFYFLYFLVVLVCNEDVCVCVCVCVCVYTYTYICYMYVHVYRGFPSGSVVKNLPAMKEMRIQFLGQENSLGEEITHSSILPGTIPWTVESGRLQSIGSKRVRHYWSDWARTQTQVYRHTQVFTATLFIITKKKASQIFSSACSDILLAF